jgi:class 3 adenylate cyclase
MASTVAPTTGLEMLTVQSFRDWARQQPLPHGSSLEVRRVALMFTDLSGSTAMYQRSGDPRAFQLVREHFATLFAVVNRAGGAVVKTIGDAIMASFVGAADAMHAALSAHAAMDALNRRFTLQGDNRLLLKVGIHCGPSIVVTLNEQLDYFGQTVNLAARIQDASLGGHITFSQAVFDEPGMFDMVGSYPVEALKVRIKGFEEPIVVNRFQVLRET